MNYEAATFTGNARGSAWMNADAQRGFLLAALQASGWGVNSLTVSRPSELSNDINFTIVLNAACDGRSKATLAGGLKAALESSGYVDRVSVIFRTSSGCPRQGQEAIGGGPRPNQVGNGSTYTVPYSGGQLATVDVPISFDDDAAKKPPVIGTTTWLLIGLAAVLILKR